MKINANSARPGNVLEHKNKLWRVVKIAHTQPGKGGAYIQMELKGLQDGIKLNERFRSSEDIEKVRLDEHEYQYLFQDDRHVTLMDTTSYEQAEINCDLFEDAIAYLQDGMLVKLMSYNGNPVSVELPETVELCITETEAVVKGQTATSSYKPAKLENGVRVMVPPFINTGERIVVRTSDGEYMERAKN
jgi:elongation factor P